MYEASCQRAALVSNEAFQPVLQPASVRQMLEPESFEKMGAFAHRPAYRRVRTNNHVQRVKRKLRYFEKVRYK